MKERGAGVLLHITSLPSPYGIGDLGPWAYKFADFLTETRQTYWQILPLSPTAPVYGNSPYSSISTFACNTLLISPDMLVEDGLLDKKEVEGRPVFPDDRCDYEGAASYKEHLLDLAYDSFTASGAGRDGYAHFCDDHASWLDTYALFVAIKKRMGGASWGEWPRELRSRAPDRMETDTEGRAGRYRQGKIPAVPLLPPMGRPQEILQRAVHTDRGRYPHLRELRQRRRMGQSAHL